MAVVAGLMTGISFVLVIVALASDSTTQASATTTAHQDATSLVFAANALGEVKEFLERYPDANLTVYLRDRCPESCPPPIVEYSYHGQGTNYADIRVLMDPDSSGRWASFVQARCMNLEDENDYAEVHGQEIDVTGFLQDEGRCPN